MDKYKSEEEEEDFGYDTFNKRNATFDQSHRSDFAKATLANQMRTPPQDHLNSIDA